MKLQPPTCHDGSLPLEVCPFKLEPGQGWAVHRGAVWIDDNGHAPAIGIVPREMPASYERLWGKKS